VFNVGVLFTIALVLLFYLTGVDENGGPMRWERWRAAWIMSRSRRRSGAESTAENAPDRRSSPVKRNDEASGNGVAMGKSPGSDPLSFPDLFTGLARIVLDKKLGETDAIRIAIRATPGKGDRYQEARRRLHAAMERESPSDEPLFRQDDGGTAPASHPVTRRPA
jgi:hypothetical protein